MDQTIRYRHRPTEIEATLITKGALVPGDTNVVVTEDCLLVQGDEGYQQLIPADRFMEEWEHIPTPAHTRYCWTLQAFAFAPTNHMDLVLFLNNDDICNLIKVPKLFTWDRATTRNERRGVLLGPFDGMGCDVFESRKVERSVAYLCPRSIEFDPRASARIVLPTFT